MLNAEVFGKNLKNERKKQSITQEKLAELVGIAVQTISYAETGKKFPHLDTAVRIANALNTSLDYLCGGSEKAEQKKADPRIETLADVQTMIDALFEEIPDSELQSEDDHIALYINNCPQIAKYYQNYITMSNLLDDRTITSQIFQMWKDGAAKGLERTTIEDYQLPF